MIKLRVDDETAIPLSVDSSSAVSMTVSEAFIDRGGSAIQNNKNATPSTSQVVVTPDPGFDGMAKVTVAAMPQGEVDPASLSYDTHLLRGRITAEANVTQAGYVPIGGNMARAYCDELLPSENPKTVTPTTSEQTAVDANKWTKGQIKVGPIPSEYIIPTGTKSIAANGTGIDVKSYEKVDVAVPGITPSGTLAIATNGSHDVTNYATANVAVPASAVDSGTKSITANGNGQDVVGYAAVNVNVPNSYAAADEGKVVSNGALVSQTSDTVTANDTYDTTLINSLTVNVSGGGGGGATKVAYGTVTGGGSGTEHFSIPVGKKMAQTDFIFALWADNGTEFSYSSAYQIIELTMVAKKTFCHYDLSSNGTKNAIGDISVDSNNGGTITSKNVKGVTATRYDIRNGSVSCTLFGNNTSSANLFIVRDSTGFSIGFYGNTTGLYLASGITYNWEVIYIGSDASNDIVEVA